MTLFWIIFGIGSVLSFVCVLLVALRKWDNITVSDLGTAIVVGIASWIGLIVLCCVCGIDIIIYRRKV